MKDKLTPILGVSGTESLSPLSAGINSGSSQSSQASITSYNPQGSWPLPGGASYTYTSMNTPGQSGLMQPNFSRPVFSATGNGYQGRTTQSPATTDGLTQQYDNISPSYPLPMPQGSSNHSNHYSQPSHHQHMQSHVLSSQAPASHPSTPSTTAPSDNYSRGPAAPNYMNSSSSATHQSYPSFAPPHPSSQQPSPTSGVMSRGIPALSSHHSPMQAPPHYHNRQYGGYQGLPSVMGGAVLSNMANPGGQMTLVGGPGMHSMPPGYGHHLGPHHGMLHHGLQAPQQDRPFKCDECPQSFNRNHDLKRHKKIHLAVKPFPCGHCEKSFSRKDALKVCLL